MEDIYIKVGERIREERLKAGLTQEELGEATDLHYSFIGYIERGKKKPSLRTIEKIANALNLPVSDLFRTVEQKQQKKPKYELTNRLLSMLQDSNKNDQEFIVNLVRTVARRVKRKTR